MQALGGSEAPLSESQLRAARGQLASYRLDADTLERFRANLKRLEGTHSFHNFTSSKTVQISNDSQVKRFMMDISCNEPFLHTCTDGTEVEWIKVSLLGQSFLLNQVHEFIDVHVCF
jgi:tRNA pseudouridine(38-40) synthase